MILKIDKTKKNRAYIGTWNNPTVTDDEILLSLEAEYLLGFIKYAIFQREQSPQSNISHVHIFVVFSELDLEDPIYRRLPTNFVFKHVKCSRHICRKYCSKEDFRISGLMK